MKKHMSAFLCVLLILAVSLCLTGCTKEYSGTKHYHMIYDNVHEANKTFTKKGQRNTLLEWREYSYCSYLLLFPREQPKSLKEFEYHWTQGIDYDTYSIYFSYELDEADYQTFKDGLTRFTISYGEQVSKPVYTEDLFEYPAHILSWSEDVDDFGFCEYILLDDANRTVINVYMLCNSLERVQEKADYPILPKNNDYAAVYRLMGENKSHFAKDAGYSIYTFGENSAPSLELFDYSLDFMVNP